MKKKQSTHQDGNGHPEMDVGEHTRHPTSAVFTHVHSPRFLVPFTAQNTKEKEIRRSKDFARSRTSNTALLGGSLMPGVFQGHDRKTARTPQYALN
ncbi:MAG TPA: hypothetical protein VF860_05540 [Candidatus Acidoferrales bacterium]